jgi:hypothetical protein
MKLMTVHNQKQNYTILPVFSTAGMTITLDGLNTEYVVRQLHCKELGINSTFVNPAFPQTFQYISFNGKEYGLQNRLSKFLKKNKTKKKKTLKSIDALLVLPNPHLCSSQKY